MACISPSDCMRFRQSRQSRPEHPAVSDGHWSCCWWCTPRLVTFISQCFSCCHHIPYIFPLCSQHFNLYLWATALVWSTLKCVASAPSYTWRLLYWFSQFKDLATQDFGCNNCYALSEACSNRNLYCWYAVYIKMWFSYSFLGFFEITSSICPWLHWQWSMQSAHFPTSDYSFWGTIASLLLSCKVQHKRRMWIVSYQHHVFNYQGYVFACFAACSND